MGIGREFEHALREEAQAREDFEKEKDETLMQWATAVEAGICDRRTDFRRSVGTGRAPVFNMAQRQLDTASSRAMQMRRLMNHDIAAPLNDDILKLTLALSKLDSVGSKWNMKVAYGEFPSPFELKRMERENKEISKPTATLVSWYSAPSYKSFVQAAEGRLAGKSQPEALTSFTFNAQDGPEEISKNRTSTLPFGPWLGFKTDSESFPLYQGDETYSVQVKIIYDKLETLAITRGEWDVDVSRYKLRSDAPTELKNLTRPFSQVVATGLGYEITLGPETAKVLILFVEEAMKGKGDVTVFGSPVDVRPNAERKKDGGEYLFKGDWSNETRAFKAIPTFDAGCAIVLGVVGEKLDIRTA